MAATDTAVADAPDWPPFYQQIAHDPDQYAILELPLFTEKGRGEDHYQVYQVLHQKPRFGGRWSRDHKLTNPHNFVKTASLFRQLWALDLPSVRAAAYPARDFLQRTNYAAQGRAILNYYQVRYIVVYKDALDRDWDAAGFAKILVQILGPNPAPYYEDAQMRVYRVPPADPPANPLTLDVGEGWFPSETRSNDGKVYRLADSSGGKASQLYTMNLTAQPVTATLYFTVYDAFQQPRTLNVALDGAALTTLPITGAQTVSLQLTLPPGNNMITFSTPEAARPTGNPADNRLLTFGMFDVSLEAQ